jgi:hypothetical protein
MLVIFSSNWDATRATGQVRLVADLWLEAVSSDASPVSWPPSCSFLQLLHHLKQVLQEIDSGILHPYHARDLAREILDRAHSKPWLTVSFPAEWEVVNAELHELVKVEDCGLSARQKARLLIAAFVGKAESEDPIRCQVDRLAELTTFVEKKPNGEERRTPFEVLNRTVQEITNDLLHRGHSRDFLHDWLPRSVLTDNGKPYLENLTAGGGLGRASAGDYSVLFGTFATQKVPGTDRIRFVAAIPNGWVVSADPLFQSGNCRLAVVKAGRCLDWQAAVQQAREELVRYLGSIPLAKYRFDRTLVDTAAARREPDGPTFVQKSERHLAERSIKNAEQFYGLRQQSCDMQTYAELDRVMYWYEQSRSWDDLGRLIALWTALEFLFGQMDASAVKGIQFGLPAYVVPQYPRLLLLDLRALLNRIEFDWPEDLLARLQATAPRKRLWTTALDKLLAACWEEEATNALLKLVGDYPNVTRKIYRIRRLQHPFKKSTDRPAVWHDIDDFEQGLLNDLRFAYRARNQIVHAAAVKVVQLDRLVQRLNWMLCTTMDVLIHQFANHPSRSLRELHEANLGSYRLWKETIKSLSPPLPLHEILQPACHGLPTRTGGQP